MFFGLKRLKTLCAQANKIHKIHQNTFVFTPQLRILNLYYNEIEELEMGALRGSPHLRHVVVSRNALKRIHPGILDKRHLIFKDGDKSEIHLRLEQNEGLNCTFLRCWMAAGLRYRVIPYTTIEPCKSILKNPTLNEDERLTDECSRTLAYYREADEFTTHETATDEATYHHVVTDKKITQTTTDRLQGNITFTGIFDNKNNVSDDKDELHETINISIITTFSSVCAIAAVFCILKLKVCSKRREAANKLNHNRKENNSNDLCNKAEPCKGGNQHNETTEQIPVKDKQTANVRQERAKINGHDIIIIIEETPDE